MAKFLKKLSGFGPLFVIITEAVVVRVYKKYFESIGELKVFDLAVITSEGFRRGICRQIPWELNKENKVGVGSSKHWPDKKYRHVTAKVVLKPTEKENVYLA